MTCIKKQTGECWDGNHPIRSTSVCLSVWGIVPYLCVDFLTTVKSRLGGGGVHGRQGGCLWSQNSVMRFMVLTANGFFLLKVYVNGSCVVFCCHVFVNVNICGYLTLFIHIQNAYIHIYSLFVFTISSTSRSFRDGTPFTVPYEGREAQ